MSDRGAGAAPAAAAAGGLVTDHQIAEALEVLLRDASSFTSLNGVVQQLESKLGVDLSHRIDFIRAQIQHFLLQPHPQPHPQTHPQNYVPQHHQRDHFSITQTPSFHPQHPPPNFTVHHAAAEGYGFLPPPQPQPQLSHPQQTAPVLAKDTSGATPSAPAKESAPPARKRRGGPGGLNKLCGVSPELQTIVGQPTMPRTEIVKQLWAYIRKNNLQDPNNKRKIICNDELRLVFETDCTDMFKMNKLLAKHILPLEPTKQAGEVAKKAKVGSVAEEPSIKRDEPIPIVMISEVLANFIGTEEREMAQAEVLRQMWEYIKVHQLEVCN
ncbi:uncharacterized protein LOC127247730 isoform X2 [Andrographis paniculata]|uniref:uncharacterized protein LOC127247730 isoform X2 n=1 Tax=Andrographis paniculata TaxID=175694 RepID=UPI0021E6DB9C|nr:uncharacterized protein LOC127247730 isoform X2 [Andrographis paniculata]